MTLRTAAGTALTRTTLLTKTAAVVDPDPLLEVTEDIYQDTQPPGAAAASRRLLFRSGQQVRTSALETLYALPTVASVAAVSGPAAGGTAVTITGTGFLRGSHVNPGETEAATAAVTFGGTAATAIVVVSDTKITCVTPAHAAGAVTVAVTTPAGAGSGAAAFTYT